MSATAPSKRKRWRNAYRYGDYGPMHIRKGRGAVAARANESIAILAPTGVVATPGSLRVTLAWNPMGNVNIFQVEKSPDGTTAWTTAALVPGYGYGTVITGLTASVIQYFRVAGTNGNNTLGAYSTVVNATPTA